MPYTGHVRKRTTKSGITTYQVIVEEESSFANGKRKRYYKTIQGGKKQAEKVMRDMIHELETRTFVKDNRITVRDFMHQWLEIYVKNQLSPTTVQHYIDQTEKYIIPQFGDTCLQQLKNIDIQKWIFSLQKASPRTGKPLSPKTIKNILLNLSAAMKKAVMLELIPKNPCDDLTLPKLEHYQPEVYSMEEVETLLQCARNTALYLPLMIEICLGLPAAWRTARTAVASCGFSNRLSHYRRESGNCQQSNDHQSPENTKRQTGDSDSRNAAAAVEKHQSRTPRRTK